MEKITLDEARASGATAITFYCAAMVRGIRCGRNGEMDLSEALTRWGAARRLHTLPLICARCGSRDVDVRPFFPFPGGRTGY